MVTVTVLASHTCKGNHTAAINSIHLAYLLLRYRTMTQPVQAEVQAIPHL
jgi:hypothetical protein